MDSDEVAEGETHKLTQTLADNNCDAVSAASTRGRIYKQAKTIRTFSIIHRVEAYINDQTIGHNYGYGIVGRSEQTTQFSTAPMLSRSPAMHQLKAAFRGVAKHQQQTRTRQVPITDHILTASSASVDGSDGGSSESREGDLRRALDTALDVLKNIQIQSGKME
ncbi:hypothetical protein JOM56_009195 [Amanita muscaria]